MPAAAVRPRAVCPQTEGKRNRANKNVTKKKNNLRDRRWTRINGIRKPIQILLPFLRTFFFSFFFDAFRV